MEAAARGCALKRRPVLSKMRDEIFLSHSLQNRAWKSGKDFLEADFFLCFQCVKTVKGQRNISSSAKYLGFKTELMGYS